VCACVWRHKISFSYLITEKPANELGAVANWELWAGSRQELRAVSRQPGGGRS